MPHHPTPALQHAPRAARNVQPTARHLAALALGLALGCTQGIVQANALADAVDRAEWNFGGRVQIDHARFDGVYSGDGAGHSASYLRRATATAAVRWHPQWRFSAGLEYDPDAKLELDVYALSWTPREGLELRLGRIDPDFGLEHSASSNWTHGVERSALWDLAPELTDAAGGTGLRADAHGDRWHASLGAYDQRGRRSVAGRAVLTPLDRKAQRLHLGASLSLSRADTDDGRLRTRLGVRGVSENDAGRRSTLAPAALPPGAYDGDISVGLEAAWQQGPWMLQAEALQRRLTGTAGQPDRLARGAYVLAAWSITGEPRRYDEERGRFRSAKPANERWGAWEVFYRLDGLGVDDGRSATVHTLGLGWTASHTWRALVNLHHARSGDRNRVGDDSGTGLSARLQAVF